jgi:hypothetical protein
MKDEFQPLEPVGHETTEARIVAWVHGEVSATEAADLEKLCAIRPDLERFRSQIADLHGLLGEATTDSGWALSAERRARLEAAFIGSSAGSASRAAKTSGRWVRPVLFAAAACVALAAGFQFIVGPVGGNRPVAKEDRNLPVITTASRVSKAPADFRADTLADEATSSPQELSAPAAPAAMPPLAATESKLADGLAAAASVRFPEVKAESIEPRKEIPAEQTLAKAAPTDVGMAMPQRMESSSSWGGDVAGKIGLSKDKALAANKSPLAELQAKFQVVPQSSDLRIEKQGDGWRFYQVTRDRREELVDVIMSDSPASRAFNLSRKTTVKLLAVDEKGAECWKKEILVNGKTLTVEAWLRQILERE